ncbi:Zinc finger protein 26 [Folsomia candida]|uniref:Zinc finger protein 26 n=1 Tax=Folsomia candida TaxID=158441 RepID=A0A226EGB9_FOLCA|nr:Zinc finger protein 26 [Folsomia candida]
MEPLKTLIATSYSCGICGAILLNKASLKRHTETTHEGKSRYHCDSCGTGFETKSRLDLHCKGVCASHVDKEGKIIKTKCDFCSETFETKKQRLVHLKEEHKDKLYNCTECDKIFLYKIDRDRHVETVHKGRQDHVCDICEKKFGTVSNLNVHKKIHTATISAAELSEPQKSLQRYRDMRAAGGRTTSSGYPKMNASGLRLHKLQQCRVTLSEYIIPDVRIINTGQIHKSNYSYTSGEDDNEDIAYVNSGSRGPGQFRLYGYVWRDGETFQIVDVYIGMTALLAVETSRRKWALMVSGSEEGCTDRWLYEKGYFFCPEESFELPDFITDQEWIARHMKMFVRTEIGTICSFSCKTAYKKLRDFIPQLRHGLQQSNQKWLDPPSDLPEVLTLTKDEELEQLRNENKLLRLKLEFQSFKFDQLKRKAVKMEKEDKFGKNPDLSQKAKKIAKIENEEGTTVAEALIKLEKGCDY